MFLIIFFLSRFFILCAGISNNLIPIQTVHGSSSPEADRLNDHLKQRHQQQLLNHDHDSIENIESHPLLPQQKPQKYDDDEQRHSNSKVLATDVDIAISDGTSNEQILYFSNLNGNENVKGNFP